MTGEIMLSAMSGAMRSALEAGASAAMFRKVREHLVVLCQSYMAAVTAGGFLSVHELRIRHHPVQTGA
jgi:hypothetical protein